MNNVVIIFEGETPAVTDFVEISNSGMVRKWDPLNGMAQVIGERMEDNGTLGDNEILVSLIGGVAGINPLFTAKVDQQGRISILKRYRDKVGIKTGDLVDVFDMKKVD